MSKRRAGDKARAVDTPQVGVGTGTSAGTRYSSSAEGKTLVQLQAERMADQKFTEMMAAAGVHPDRMALEVMYWLPKDFLDLYQELYIRALRNTDGGTGERGKAAQETADLAKAKRKTTGGGGKKFKRYWVIADETVLDMKTKVDKRLRAIARDMRGELEELDFHREREEKSTRQERSKLNSPVISACPECKIIVSKVWNYCPKCGCSMGQILGN